MHNADSFITACDVWGSPQGSCWRCWSTGLQYCVLGQVVISMS